MRAAFHTLALLGKPRHPGATNLHQILYDWLTTQGYAVLIDEAIADFVTAGAPKTASLDQIGQQADLAIVIGGDGNMLNAARRLAAYDINVIGINRGNLGFLTDLAPDNVLPQLDAVLRGEAFPERRFLLEATVGQRRAAALNEVVLHPGKVAHMIEFEVYIDDCFAFSQRSDGLIITTPTGSTAYSLSAGGPILMPGLDAIALVPMFPHTLSSRPLVINSDSTIRLRFANMKKRLEISCDSQITLPVLRGEEVVIRRSTHFLQLLHPLSYNYFNTLSTKLGWSKKLF